MTDVQIICTNVQHLQAVDDETQELTREESGHSGSESSAASVRNQKGKVSTLFWFSLVIIIILCLDTMNT